MSKFKQQKFQMLFTNKKLVINKATRVQEDIIPRVKQENNINMTSEDLVLRTPYRHPNHKSQ